MMLPVMNEVRRLTAVLLPRRIEPARSGIAGQ
jgi:hypothetical protein